MTDEEARRLLADLLWREMVRLPDAQPQTSGVRGLWRRYGYLPLDVQVHSRVERHASPEPWLTLKCGIQAMSGDGFLRDERRYECIEGGRSTEIEYQNLVRGLTRLPVVMLGGFPRSGTTSVQSVIRATWPSQIPEVATENRRFSLWENPKHSMEAIHDLAHMPSSIARVVISIRRFDDAVASLMVGRGSHESVDVEKKVVTWTQWMELACTGSCVVIPYESVKDSTPAELQDHLSKALSLPIEVPITAQDSFADLMGRTSKGSVIDERQSNLPHEARRELLAAARQEVRRQVGAQQLATLDMLYMSASGMSALGTDEPE